jgi:hypothetical protein
MLLTVDVHDERKHPGPVQSSSLPPLVKEWEAGVERVKMYCQLLVIMGGTVTKFPQICWIRHITLFELLLNSTNNGYYINIVLQLVDHRCSTTVIQNAQHVKSKKNYTLCFNIFKKKFALSTQTLELGTNEKVRVIRKGATGISLGM